MKFKGVIFDLDGTLINSLEDIADSMNNVLQKYGFPSHGLHAYKHFIGNGIKNLVREALPETSKKEELILKCFDLMMEEYRNNCTNKTQPYDGIVELLNELTTRNLKLAVLSNKVDDLTKKVVMTLLSNWNFEVVIGTSCSHGSFCPVRGFVHFLWEAREPSPRLRLFATLSVRATTTRFVARRLNLLDSVSQNTIDETLRR